MALARKKRNITPADPATILTALHIGASSVSIIIAERNENGKLTPIDFLEQPAPLAQDVFGGNVVSNATTERIVSIIRGYQQTLSELGLDPHNLTRAVATNVLHEAANHEAVLNRIRIACGLPVSMIDDGEMTRLIYLKTSTSRR
jgi:exopolyphosphatase / guanosine-5'-triphosphate,3'-diphosphate pyrophosphatase